MYDTLKKPEQKPRAKATQRPSDQPLVQQKAESPMADSTNFQPLPFNISFNEPAAAPVQRAKDGGGTSPDYPLQKKAENNAGLPDGLKAGVESLSGYSMDDVKVHYGSAKPGPLHAHAYTQGTDIHVAPGQERHLPHEAWHVVQQKQGRVQPTMQLKGKNNITINDDSRLEREADSMGEKAMKAGPKSDVQESKPNLTVTQKQPLSAPLQMAWEGNSIACASGIYRFWRSDTMASAAAEPIESGWYTYSSTYRATPKASDKANELAFSQIKAHLAGRTGGSSSDGLTSEALTDILEVEVDALHEASRATEDQALKLMRNLAAEARGSKLMPGPIKSRERVMEKAKKKTRKTRDSGDDTSSTFSTLSGVMSVGHDIKDILRCTLVFDDFTKLTEGYINVAKFLQNARSGIVVGIIKMDSWFGSGTEQKSGYRDAKIIFQIEPPKAAEPYIDGMHKALSGIAIEVQFNVRSALAVKDAKVHGEGEEGWNFVIKKEDAGYPLDKFNAVGFLNKLLVIAAESKDKRLQKEIRIFQRKNAGVLKEGLPIAHHLYEADKVTTIAEHEGISEAVVSDTYNPLYKELYDFAYRANRFDQAAGDAFHLAYTRKKASYVG